MSLFFISGVGAGVILVVPCPPVVVTRVIGLVPHEEGIVDHFQEAIHQEIPVCYRRIRAPINVWVFSV